MFFFARFGRDAETRARHCGYPVPGSLPFSLEENLTQHGIHSSLVIELERLSRRWDVPFGNGLQNAVVLFDRNTYQALIRHVQVFVSQENLVKVANQCE